ncbi:Smc5-Smc6 complex subunit NSE4 [Lachancea thermotolerans CBS 6340]|uniref:Non-structural maintenance of chromosomes element 4 n=1 Tax=Lachancea thermotolerans (strain ATCC 56472 / CBS 6340 / NRRL Y-8284) TaxID=559295 RepID=C5DL40_LACTC|nr:KLTH0F09746p [Lachancea thermotolerans CBS 6340]CAR24191.1 KLTH0F09746p [Lachancea thermotolerans CBS 6340]
MTRQREEDDERGNLSSKRRRTEVPQAEAEQASALEEDLEFEILQGYRDVDKDVSKDRVEVARNGDIAIALDRLKAIDTLFDRMVSVNSNRNSLLAQDSKAALNVSELAQLSVRNLKLDESQRVLGISDVINYSKRFMLKEYFNANGIKQERAKVNSSDDAEEEDSSNAQDDSATNQDVYAQGRQQRSLLDQFDQYNRFTQFNWFKMGMLFRTISKTPLTVDHLLGPFAAEKKIRSSSQRIRTTDIVGEAVTAERVTKSSLNSTQEETTPEQVKKCFKVLIEKNGLKQINLFKFIIHPKSFAKSVENLFYTSFLIKGGKLVLEEDEDGFPAIRPKEGLPKNPHDREVEIQRRNDARQNHIIFQLDMATWRRLIQRFDITSPFIP